VPFPSTCTSHQNSDILLHHATVSPSARVRALASPPMMPSDRPCRIRPALSSASRSPLRRPCRVSRSLTHHQCMNVLHYGRPHRSHNLLFMPQRRYYTTLRSHHHCLDAPTLQSILPLPASGRRRSDPEPKSPLLSRRLCQNRAHGTVLIVYLCYDKG
jgi:hypothetical protein